MMSLRALFRRPVQKGLAATFSVSLVAAVVGCSDSGSVEKATVYVSEPVSASNTAPAPAAATNSDDSSKTAEAAKAPSDTAKPAEAPAATGSAAGWGTLKGRVVFSADAPAPKVLVAKGDMSVKDGAICSKEGVNSERLVVNKENKGVKYAIVYINKPTAVNKEAESAVKSAEVIFDQKNCTFTPHVLAMMKGQTVQVKSSDAVGHNANGVGLIKNVKFNMTTPPGSAPIPYTVRSDESKPADVNCDIHNWMKAYWFPVAHPYFAVTDADGNFEIKNVPAGDQKVVVWAEALGPGYITAPAGDVINIKASGETLKDFTLDAAKVK